MQRIAILVLLAVAAAAIGTAVTGSWPWSRAATIAPGLDPGDRKTESGQPEQSPDLEATSTARADDAAKGLPESASQGVQISKVPVPGGTHFRLPDGTWAPALNGVRNAPAMDWPDEVPWSPIKRKIIGKKGFEWYEHEDGSYSLTRMLYRTDLGREEAVTHVINPTEALPMRGEPKDPPPKTGAKKN